jgi:hypothetical protein
MPLAMVSAGGISMMRDNKTVWSPGEFIYRLASEQGAIGYIAAWLLGVPASLLFLIFLLRGCT